ncbi:hypothetical protein [Bradyrhizobium ganzhouense]|uniref:hypothetical protein n=1 Tax=Bradyrhizobium ganzhouense TaxID=1179767 RepID=UPI003CF0690F
MTNGRKLAPESDYELTVEQLLDLRMGDTNKAFLAFGKAMAAWARIEVGFYIWFEHITAFDLRQAKPIYYSATSFSARLSLIRAAITGVQLEADEMAFIDEAMKLANPYSSFRNKLAHGEFTLDGLVIEGKHVDRKLARAEAISADKLKKYTHRFNDFAELLLQARDLALGFNDEDHEPGLTLSHCTQRVAALRKELTG